MLNLLRGIGWGTFNDQEIWPDFVECDGENHMLKPNLIVRLLL
jgi:hypothetical protein